MAITTAFCSSAKLQLLRGQFCFIAGPAGTFTSTTATAATTVNYTGVDTTTMSLIREGMTFTGTNVGASSAVLNVVGAQAFTSTVASTGAVGNLTFTNPHGGTIKLALYTSAATMDATTTTYSATNEATGVTAGGLALTLSTSMPTQSTTTSFIDYADLVFSAVTTTARGCLIYDSYGAQNRALQVNDFGADKTSTAGDFTIIFPAPAAGTAIMQLS